MPEVQRFMKFPIDMIHRLSPLLPISIAWIGGEADAFGGKTSVHPLVAFQIEPSSLAESKIIPAGRSSRTYLLMSSIPEEDDGYYSSQPNLSRLVKSAKEVLPPMPEDQTALSGDILAVGVYSYLDHTVHDMCAEAARMDVGDYLTAIDSANAPSLPVWFDVTQINQFGHWLTDSSSVASYAPAIANGGLAFVVMSTCWIISGYFSGAFLMKNTLECDAKNAILVTGKTWCLMTVLMVGLALGSDALWGQLDTIYPLSDPARGGLTKADADYIFDSLSVLAFWRWMFNNLMGYR